MPAQRDRATERGSKSSRDEGRGGLMGPSEAERKYGRMGR